jgi:hypothetical protein
MENTSSKFKKRIQRYEELNSKGKLDSNEKREKVILKDFINEEILSYKKDSNSWILTNGPTGAGKKEYVEENEQELVASK